MLSLLTSIIAVSIYWFLYCCDKLDLIFYSSNALRPANMIGIFCFSRVLAIYLPKLPYPPSINTLFIKYANNYKIDEEKLFYLCFFQYCVRIIEIL